ncbi:hypothetical protein RN001_014034 [Aquatica leii]|uniref:PDZ and pleckstrin homology domains 1 n=1 Tax=Aquatica leii TaxID=1421715 RepID=A0AAN7P0Y5_9COLE|nr:hypothetical protein RN001_014034 [Aquatica leii]
MFVLESIGEQSSLRRNLEELLKLMLLIWCKENEAIKLISGKPNADTDKTIAIQRRSGPFGFRLHGSRPILVSAIEPDTPAESSGLEVGDVLLTINGINVLDKNHSEVIEIAKSCGDSLVFEVVKTCTILNPVSKEVPGEAICCGYLWKLSGYASGVPSNKWLRRWFTLKTDNCLYFYKTDSDTQPVGAIMLLNYEAARVYTDTTETFRFDLRKNDLPTLHLAADTEEGAIRWLSALQKVIDKCQMVDTWVEKTKRNQMLAPDAITNPDCFGYLIKSSQNCCNRRYCILKEACLYFYHDINSKNAFGVACLYGYKVERPRDEAQHAFDIIPEDLNRKRFHFFTDSDQDQKRWIAALEYSIKQSQWCEVDLK